MSLQSAHVPLRAPRISQGVSGRFLRGFRPLLSLATRLGPTPRSSFQIVAAGKSTGKKTQKPQKSSKRKKSPQTLDLNACPCGSSKPYGGCCELYHTGSGAEETAEGVMRARFSAYAKGLPKYVVDSTHLDCPLEVDLKQEDGTYGPGFLQDCTDYCERYTFTKLSILQKSPGESEDEARVYFKVWYRVTANPGDQQTMTEQSIFRRVDGRWLYYDRVES